MQTLFGTAGATAVQTLLECELPSYLGNSRMATAVGSVTLLIGASSVFLSNCKTRSIESGGFPSAPEHEVCGASCAEDFFP